MATPPSNRKGGGDGDILNPHVEWYLWRPCVGIQGLVEPLAKWSDMIDGTYQLKDVKDMHSVMDEILHQKELTQNG